MQCRQNTVLDDVDDDDEYYEDNYYILRKKGPYIFLFGRM